jgi:hypothetical protein
LRVGHSDRAQKAGSAERERERSGLSLRAVPIGLVLVVVVCFVVSYAELVIERIQIGFLQMPPAVIGIFFFLVLLNTQMRRLGHALSLTSSELLMIYCMMLVAAMISSRGIMEKIIPLMVTPNYFANQGNRWNEIFYPYIKKWMVAFDPNGPDQQPTTKMFFEGLRGGHSIPRADWALPMLTWGLLVLLVIFAFLCIATIIRRQWGVNVRPHVHHPWSGHVHHLECV